MNKKHLTLTLAAILATATVANAQVIVSEAFDGPASPSQVNLTGTTADTFAASIATAGGSSTWSASSRYKTSGAITSPGTGNSSAFLYLGSYINDTKGTDAGIFEFSVTLSDDPSSASWLGIAIFGSVADTSDHFVDNDATAAMIYRQDGDIDPFANGSSNSPTEDGGSFSGSQTFTMTLDLTTAGGYNGSTNFGTVSYSVGATSLGSYTYLSAGDADFQYIGMTQAAASGGDGYYSNLTLTQIPEPGTYALLAGCFALSSVMIRRRRG